MRVFFVISIFLVCYSGMTQLSVEGLYSGKNLYVSNPMDDEGFGYCADSVYVNGEKYTLSKVQAGAFEIELSNLGLEDGDSVHVVIYHQSGCKPKILNAHGPPFHSKPRFTDISIDSDSIRWTIDKYVATRYEIQVYRWNKWVTLGTLQSQGMGTTFAYAVSGHFHSGENQLRVRAKDPVRGVYSVSDEVRYGSNIPKVTLTYNKETRVIHFSRITSFELYDAFGNIVGTGRADSLEFEADRKGVYYVNFDNENQKVKVK